MVVAYNRPRTLARILEQLTARPIGEVIVVDNGSSVDLQPIAERMGARFVRLKANRGVAARNIAARIASGDLLLMLDDDSYPQPGTVLKMQALFARSPDLGAVGGKVVDVSKDDSQPIRKGDEVGSFDWFSRFGSNSDQGSEDMPTFFAAEGASMIRRIAYQQVGGCFEPYFRDLTELDLATRLLAAGWDVRYLATAAFNHIRADEWRASSEEQLRFRVRNQVWYFWRHFPASVAARRIIMYLTFDLIECLYRQSLRAWTGGVHDAWYHRRLVRGTRRPVARSLLPRIELHRGRAHIALLVHRVTRKLSRS